METSSAWVVKQSLYSETKAFQVKILTSLGRSDRDWDGPRGREGRRGSCGYLAGPLHTHCLRKLRDSSEASCVNDPPNQEASN